MHPRAGHSFHYHCITPYLKSKRGQDVIICPIGPWIWEFERRKEGERKAEKMEKERYAGERGPV